MSIGISLFSSHRLATMRQHFLSEENRSSVSLISVPTTRIDTKCSDAFSTTTIADDVGDQAGHQVTQDDECNKATTRTKIRTTGHYHQRNGIRIHHLLWIAMVLTSQYLQVLADVGTVHDGFIVEIVTTVPRAVSGVFAPNPRNDGKPMMILNSQHGEIHILEDPDDSPDSIVVLNLKDHLCSNHERGLHSVIPHPNFKANRWLYAFYTKFREGCLDDAERGPWNVVTRFTMDDSLKLDYNKREEIWRGK